MIMSFSKRLKMALKHKGVNQSDLARKLKTRPSTVSDWITGKTTNPSADLIVTTANYLGVNITWLLNGKGAMEDSNESSHEKEYIFKCLQGVIDIYPDIEPQKLLIVGTMLYNKSKTSRSFQKGDILALVSLLD